METIKYHVKAYYDLVVNDRGKKYGVLRLANADEIAAEMGRRECELVADKTLVIREGWAPGGALQGTYSTAPELIRGKHELEEVERIV